MTRDYASEEEMEKEEEEEFIRIVHARGAIPHEMETTCCRATPAVTQSADQTRTPVEEQVSVGGFLAMHALSISAHKAV